MTTINPTPPSIGVIRLDDNSIRLARGAFTARRYRNAVAALQPLLADKPITLEVRSVTKKELGGYVIRDEAVATVTRPDGSKETKAPFQREFGVFGFLESPYYFLKRTIQELCGLK